jgi:hypothetical protein
MGNKDRIQAATSDVFASIRTLTVEEFNDLVARDGLKDLIDDAWRRHRVNEPSSVSKILDTVKKMVTRDKS